MRVEKLIWTKHSEAKMHFYHLSKQRVRRVLNSPKRIEEGIAPNTIAMMQPAGSQKHPYEIWVMIQKHEQARTRIGTNTEKNLRKSAFSPRKSAITKVISAWKYPGRTKPHSEITLDFLKREYEIFISNGINRD
jgi:hypothetical protein